jgi:hypothetical protein
MRAFFFRALAFFALVFLREREKSAGGPRLVIIGEYCFTLCKKSAMGLVILCNLS